MSQKDDLIQMALDELGIPNKDYPAPIANAVAFLQQALKLPDEYDRKRIAAMALTGYNTREPNAAFSREDKVQKSIKDADALIAAVLEVIER